MVTLRIIPERLLDARPSGERRYAQNLGEQLIVRAPADCDVEAILPKVGDDEAERIAGLLPGIAEVTQAPRRRDALATAWRRGMHTGRIGGGFIHAMSLYAPMRDISLSGGIDQTVVTAHDTIAARRPELLTRDSVQFANAMLKRAVRYASAIAAPSHAVANELTELYGVGDRVRVIGGAADRRIDLPDTEDEGDRLAERMQLPEDYVLTLASAEPRKGLEPLLRAFALPELADLPLVVIGAPTWSSDPSAQTTDALITATGIDRKRVVTTGEVSDTMLAVALQRASAIVVPSLESGFGLPIVEAFQIGTPVVASDTASHLEVAADAARFVERGDVARDPATYASALAEAVHEVVHDTEAARRLRVAGRDRSGIYHWGASADAVWALHADL